MLDLGKHEKIEIIAYTNPKRTGKGMKLVFKTNPTYVANRHENQFSNLLGINTSGRTAVYAKSFSDTLSLNLVLDDTIAVENIPLLKGKQKSVSDQIKVFMTACAYMDGKIHEPRYLKVKWGVINFECRLKSVEVKYTQFDEQGNPVRAELDTVFVQDIPSTKRVRLENKKSPDITHTRIVQQGDTISGLCKMIYDDASQYLMVAQVNKLNHFRQLTPGQELIFPPLDK